MIVASVLFVVLMTAGVAYGQDTNPVVRANAEELTITARLHTQFNTTSADGQRGTEWMIRRARLESGARINDVVSGHVQMEFAGNTATVMHAFMDLDFRPELGLRVGRAFKPFGLFSRTASTLFIPIEAGLRIRGVTGLEAYSLLAGLEYGERGTGVQLEGVVRQAPVPVRYNVGWFEGPLAGTGGMGELDDHAFAGRIDAWPSEPMRLGLSWSRRHFVERGAGNRAVGPLIPGNAFALDFEWGTFGPGFHLMTELAVGVADGVTEERFASAGAWSAWRSEVANGPLKNIEPVARVSWADVSGGGLLVTPGLNLYFAERNRIMVNYDFWRPAEGDGAGSFKVMFAMWF